MHAERKHRVLYHFKCIYFSYVEAVETNITDTLKNAFISQMHVDTVDTKKEKPHTVHERC